MQKRAFLVALAALLFATLIEAGQARANPDFELGPAINAKAPDIGMPPDQTGAPRALASLMGDKGMVLFFFRSADWCPYCQAQMMDLNTAVAGIERRGYKMAGISYDRPEILKTFIERRNIGYTLLSDPKSEIIDRYKLRDPHTPQAISLMACRGRSSSFSIRTASSKRSCMRTPIPSAHPQRW